MHTEFEARMPFVAGNLQGLGKVLTGCRGMPGPPLHRRQVQMGGCCLKRESRQFTPREGQQKNPVGFFHLTSMVEPGSQRQAGGRRIPGISSRVEVYASLARGFDPIGDSIRIADPCLRAVEQKPPGDLREFSGMPEPFFHMMQDFRTPARSLPKFRHPLVVARTIAGGCRDFREDS